MTADSVLVSFTREEPAQLLADYLCQQGIEVEVSEGQGEMPFVLCLVHTHQAERALKIVEDFINDPHHPKYQASAWESGHSLKTSQSLPMAMNLPGVKELLSVPLTALVLAICLLVFALSSLGWQYPLFQALQFEPVPQLLVDHQWWRLFGPAFIHFSLVHLVFNLLWWWTLGGQIEAKLGVKTLLGLFVFSALVSNYAQFLTNGPNFGGLSGVVYAVLGFVWIYGWKRPQAGLNISTPVVGFMLIWLLLGYADVLWVSMANTAHTMGLVSGVVMALWMSARPESLD